MSGLMQVADKDRRLVHEGNRKRFSENAMRGSCKTKRPSARALRNAVRVAVLTAATAVVCACSGGSGGMGAVDTRITTASVPTAIPGDLVPDGKAMLSALSGGAQPGGSSDMSWENPESGARGVIISSEKAEHSKCLGFTATRQSFDGIALYQGTACEDAAGVLRLLRLAPL